MESAKDVRPARAARSSSRASGSQAILPLFLSPHAIFDYFQVMLNTPIRGIISLLFEES